MKKDQKKKYDAWGNPILDRAAMLAYYVRDAKSYTILHHNMPHRIVVLPDVEIRFDAKNPVTYDVFLIYPGGTITYTREMTDKALCAFRKAYRGKKGWSGRLSKWHQVVIRHTGRVMREWAGKYSDKISH